jgi:hypothetical protein
MKNIYTLSYLTHVISRYLLAAQGLAHFNGLSFLLVAGVFVIQITEFGRAGHQIRTKIYIYIYIYIHLYVSFPINNVDNSATKVLISDESEFFMSYSYSKYS